MIGDVANRNARVFGVVGFVVGGAGGAAMEPTRPVSVGSP